MSALEKVYSITEQLFQLVSKSVNKDSRDEVIEEITSLLDTRDELIKAVQPPFTANDKQLYNQITTWNDIIDDKMTEIKANIQQDMMQLKKSKSSNQQYINPYQNVNSSDGMFYDKRK
ncbi:hypothetical protein [Metabacillus malikii]|uniref:Flagellar protein FliT n=1 Tax=Metabacillus malikii TaxID=1504265 RepID=A0ABT9ZGR9_9BACI|nr:hypothetical protein [Metabacillus malikii]MDQ0231466.1 flagellar protein FliT [Metabacillus malikii]